MNSQDFVKFEDKVLIFITVQIGFYPRSMDVAKSTVKSIYMALSNTTVAVGSGSTVIVIA